MAWAQKYTCIISLFNLVESLGFIFIPILIKCIKLIHFMRNITEINEKLTWLEDQYSDIYNDMYDKKELRGWIGALE